MSNYSCNPGNCRVDFFKPSGKWYDTYEVDWSKEYNSSDIGQSFINVVFTAVGDNLIGMTAVCLEPYHQNAFPLSMVWKGLR